MKYPAILLTTVLASALSLAGCGGGSGSGSDDDDPINEPTPGLMQSDSNPTVGSSTELILLQPNQDVSQISWQQTSGAEVTLLSSNSKVVAFTIPASGDYSFKVDYLDGSVSKSESISFSAGSGSNKLVARLGHSVVEQGAVSLRAFTSSDIDTTSIAWQQLSGPAVSFDFDNTNTAIAIFSVPSVSADSVIELEVTATTTAGDTHKDRVSLLIENRPNMVSDALFDDALANIHAYNANSPFADALVKCVYSNQIENKISELCELSELPILAQTSNGLTPTIEQIMDRVVVSHDWMAENFRAYLEEFDGQHDDFKNLFRATTAIVLSYDVRPSFYWAATGAIYLDPNNYWLTAEQRDTINEAPDYRANFGVELQFVMPWRYVKDNDYVSFNYPVNDRFNRGLTDIKFELADLLYHELAHANDYLPPAEWSGVSASDSFYEAATEFAEISDDMIIRYPLQSQEMKDLAAVRFLGETANATQKAYTPGDVAVFYKNDISNGFYNYTNEKEDLGILFESLMMSLRYGVQRDTAVTSDSDGGYVVSWGQRGRIAEPGISERASYVTSRLLPEFDLDLVDTLPAPIQMTPGLDWWDNLPISPSVPQALQVLLLKSSKALQPKVRTHQHHARPMPKE